MKRRDSEQLNTPVVSESYDLEDIIREFRSAPAEEKAPESPAATVKEHTLVFQPIRSAPKPPPAEDAPVKIAPDLRSKKQSPLPKPEPPAEKPAPLPTKVANFPTRSAPSGKKRSDFQPPLVVMDRGGDTRNLTEKGRRPERPKPQEELPSHSRSCRELLSQSQRGFALRRIRTALMLLPMLFSLLLTLFLFCSDPVPLLLETYGSLIFLGALLLSMLLGYEVLIRGIRDLLHVRISIFTLAVPLCVLCIIQSFLEGDAPLQTYAPCVTTLLFFLQYSINLSHHAYARSLHTVCGFTKPMGLYDAGQLLPDSDSLRKDNADIEDYLARLTEPDAPQTLLCLYATFLLPLSCGISFLIHYFTGTAFVYAWLLILLCAVPLYATVSYPAAFSSLARKMAKQGGALCGWHSAKSFGKRHTIILRDEDLFPVGSFHSNGMKLYGTYRAERVIAYAHAAFSAAENPLVQLFEELLRSEGATALTASTYRFYENNGMGAEILGDEVLIGTLSFMRSMGVHMPGGARVRQAVYVAISGELAGIFAVRYKPSAAAASGLRDILANRNFTPVLATRDFLISPELIAQKYDLSTEAIRCPEYPQRIRLSETAPGDRRVQGALIANNSFSAFAATVASAHRLKLSTWTALILSLLAGIGGLCLATLLLLSGSSSLTSASYIAAYQLLWASATGLVSLILRKL